jgi:hypothetical protein
MRILIAIALLSCSIASRAAETDISCYWEPYKPKNGIKRNDFGEFYATPRDALKLRVGVDPDSVSFPDAQSADAIIFPSISLVSLDSSLKISAPAPNIRSIKGQPSLITILIDRYTLDSSMLLALIDPATGELGGQWVRSGKCTKRQL